MGIIIGSIILFAMIGYLVYLLVFKKPTQKHYDERPETHTKKPAAKHTHYK